MAFIYAIAQIVPVRRRVRVCRDPNDDKFLEVAVSGGAEFIVTGDRDLLTLDPFEDISIVTPAEYPRRAGAS